MPALTTARQLSAPAPTNWADRPAVGLRAVPSACRISGTGPVACAHRDRRDLAAIPEALKVTVAELEMKPAIRTVEADELVVWSGVLSAQTGTWSNCRQQQSNCQTAKRTSRRRPQRRTSRARASRPRRAAPTCPSTCRAASTGCQSIAAFYSGPSSRTSRNEDS